MDSIEPIENQTLRLGSEVLSWRVHEYPRHDRGRRWFVISAVFGALLIIYAIATANFMFAVIILMVGIIILVSSFKEPDEIDIILTTTGLVVGNVFYDFRSMKNFSIAYEPPDVKNLYIDFSSIMQPLLSVPLADMDPNAVRELFLKVCPEDLERSEETLTDMVRRLYKL